MTLAEATTIFRWDDNQLDITGWGMFFLFMVAAAVGLMRTGRD